MPGRGKSAGDKKPSAKEVLQQFTGKIDKIEKDSLTIQAPDTRVITFKCSKITKYLQDDKEIQRAVLKPGHEVDIEARSDDEGYFYAVNVRLKKPAEPPAKPAAREEGQAPAGRQQATVIEAPAPQDPDVPKLRRGKPVPRPRAADEEPEAERLHGGRDPRLRRQPPRRARPMLFSKKPARWPMNSPRPSPTTSATSSLPGTRARAAP